MYAFLGLFFPGASLDIYLNFISLSSVRSFGDSSVKHHNCC